MRTCACKKMPQNPESVARMTGRIGLLAMGLLLSMAGRAANEPIRGIWQQHEYRLEYRGLMSNYSCDQLEWKLRILLKTAGARSDVKIATTCIVPDCPSPGAIAQVTFFTLRGAATDNSTGGIADSSVRAQWHKAHLWYGSPSELRAEDC